MSTTTPRIDIQNALLAPHALLANGWASDVLLVWDAAGRLISVTPNAGGIAGIERAPGCVVPGMPNLHSHAFQRAFAGLTEYRGDANQGGRDDSFWTWREHMYRFASALTPQALEDIATHLYVEMLRAGYTSVCEFHYVHQDAGGKAYAEPAQLALCIAAAAKRAGIGLTLLPVLYQTNGFGGKPPASGQRRFINDVDGLLRIVERLHASDATVGVAPHSLRAVPPDALSELIHGLHAMDPKAPVHIHIAEQQREVEDCVAWSGARPVQWLVDHALVDERWCLVHATHIDDMELAAIAKSGAVVGLCPSTEANLGDGMFPTARYLDLDGAWGIGSDSHATVDAAEELRLLEYTQRLVSRRRNVLARADRPNVAERLWMDAVAGGARASARPIAGLVPGQRADFLVLADEMAQDLTPSQAIASHVFARHPNAAPHEVWVAGQCRVRDGHHALEAQARRAFLTARKHLLDQA